MKVLIQWATATVSDWVEYTFTNLADVRAVPKKPEPTDSPIIDDDAGWIAAINVQGVVFESWDHIGFDIDGNGHLVVGAWNDDPVDWPDGEWGVVYTFGDPAPDPVYGGAVNTVQTVTRFADTATLTAMSAAGWVIADTWLARNDVQPWSAYPRFNKQNIIHGVWVSDIQQEAYQSIRSKHGWREWVA